MAPPNSFLFTLAILLLTCLPATTMSQKIDTSLPAVPTMAECGPQLLPLAPCAPFVQGTAVSPTPTCCDNLKQQYGQQPNCLCLLLNGTTVNSFPINTTLALLLPNLCNLRVDYSLCSGVSMSASSPRSQVSLGETSNSTDFTSGGPQTEITPPNMTGFKVFSGTSSKMKTEGQFWVLMVALMAFQFTSILC